MGIGKLLEKIDKMELGNKIIFFILLVGAVSGCVLYMAALIIPNWEPYLDNPILYQSVGIGVAVFILFLIFFIIIITIKTAITNYKLSEKNVVLEEENTAFSQRVQILEKELNRLKRDD